MWIRSVVFFFFQAEDGIRDLVRSRGLGDVYKRQVLLRLRQLQDRQLLRWVVVLLLMPVLFALPKMILSLIHI